MFDHPLFKGISIARDDNPCFFFRYLAVYRLWMIIRVLSTVDAVSAIA